MSEELCEVTFPGSYVVTGKPGEIVEDSTVTMERSKALKISHTTGAKVTSESGEVLSNPVVEVVDHRAEAASDKAARLESENRELHLRLDKLEAALALKADRPGPKPGAKQK